ncbi:MAG: CPBP family intramembrane glutamic endopeptidase [Bacteroidota bacterium]
MKKIWKLLRQFVAEDFTWKLYLSIAIFLAISIVINYAINLENGIIDKHAGKPIRVFYYFLLYGFGYFFATVIVFGFNKQLSHFRSKRYWTITLLALLFLSMSNGFPYTTPIAKAISGDNNYTMFLWTFGLTNNLVNFFIQTLPLLVLAWYFEKNRQRENFGVNRNNIDLRPYFQVLMIVLPLVIIASFESGFRNYYPLYHRYEITALKNPTDLPEWLFAIGYEIAYGMDFFNVEFMFRGVLIIGVSQVIGKEAVLPMVVTYCFLHFGKPVGECVSSIFGGYILGVVAFYTRNIWGGVIVHIGLAWMMELAAFIQRMLN